MIGWGGSISGIDPEFPNGFNSFKIRYSEIALEYTHMHTHSSTLSPKLPTVGSAAPQTKLENEALINRMNVMTINRYDFFKLTGDSF